MSKFLSNLSMLRKRGDISAEQQLYLIYLDVKLPHKLSELDIKKLVKAKLVHGNVPDIMLYSAMSPIKIKGSVESIHCNDISREVTKKLCKMMCVKEKGKLHIPGKESDPLAYTAEEYLKSEHAIVYQFIIFMFMFPSKDTYNIKWERHFIGAKYTGMPLRIRSKAIGDKFIKMAKKKDMGAFLLGTYKYIKSTVSGNKAYTTTMIKYMASYDDWYLEALDEISNASTVEELFSDASNGQDMLNVIL